MTVGAPSYKGFHFPAEIISHCVWLYYRFPLSFREAEEMMLQRGITLSHETVRQWCARDRARHSGHLPRARHHQIGVHTNRLRALLLDGDNTDRQIARGALIETILARLILRRPPQEASRRQAVQHAEIRRLAIALRETARALEANRAQLHTSRAPPAQGVHEARHQLPQTAPRRPAGLGRDSLANLASPAAVQ